MKEIPIIFHARSICGILEERKSQTRRLNGLTEINKTPHLWHFERLNEYQGNLFASFRQEIAPGLDWIKTVRCPYGQPGDRLWVKETLINGVEKGVGVIGTQPLYGSTIQYKATLTPVPFVSGKSEIGYMGHAMWQWPDRKTISAMFMPHWACRLVLEITDVRVERVQEISEEDVWAEGVFRIGDDLRTPAPVLVCDEPEVKAGMAFAEHRRPYFTYAGSPREAFETLWDDTNGKGAWERNDWVWVVTFKRLS